MSILTHSEILSCIEKKEIEIDPFDVSCLGPNSYDLHLSPNLKRITSDLLDVTEPYDTEDLVIPEEGLILRSTELYLGSTIEHTKTDCFVPCLDGKSTLGRYFLSIHETAGRGDIGFSGQWTLEMSPSVNIRVFPGIKVAQISWYTIKGEANVKYDKTGHYNDQKGPQKAVPMKHESRI